MKFWKITAPQKMEKGELKNIELPEGFARVKLSRVGLSFTDVNIFNGTTRVEYPVVPGRHGVGIISEVEDNNVGLSRGQKVVLSSFSPCGTCNACINLKTAECPNMQYLGVNRDGLLRDFALVSMQNLHQLPPHISDNTALFVEHAAIAIKAFNDLNIQKGEYVVITAASIIGIMLAQVALYYQAVPIVIDYIPEKLKTAQDLGVFYTINSMHQDPLDEIIKITGGRKCEKVAYLLSSNMYQKSFEFAARGGTLALLGWQCNVDDKLNGSLRAVLENQLTVIGISNYTKQIPAAINLLANKSICVDPLISKEITFDESPETLLDMSENLQFYFKTIVRF